MANTTIEELLNLAYEVRDADQAGENTALRVGGLLEEIIQYLSTVVGLDTLQTILEDYATVTGGGLISWRHSRIICLASMGYDLDNIDGGDWNYTNFNGDIVFSPIGGGRLNVVGTTGDFSVFQNVVYVNNHTGHAYLWKLVGNTYKMVEIRDSSPTTIITYLNTPPFSDVAIGESYYYESGATKKIAVKLSSESTYSFDIDPKKIYVFKDVKQTMVWSSGTWVPVGGGGGGGGSAGVSAFENYEAYESISALPGQGVATTGYIVGTHIYAYVNTGGDTKDGKYQDLGTLDAAGVSVTTSEDGTFAIHNGNDIYIINLNHEHPQYQPLLTAGANITITTDPQTGEVTISAAGGSGGGGGTQVQADWNQTDSTAVDYIKNKPTIPVVPTAVSAFTNDAGYLTQHQSLAGRVQSQDIVNIVKMTQAAYDALQTKDNTTLYLITES